MELIYMNIENKLFHSIIPYGHKYDKEKMLLMKLKSIFYYKKILCREEIDKVFNYHNYCAINFNGRNYVSLCEFIKREYNDFVISRGDDALGRYPLSNLTIVLNRNLLNENRLVTDNYHIPYEVQVEGNVDLKYMEAISIPIEYEQEKIISLIRKNYINIPLIRIEKDKLDNVKILKK